MLDEAFSEIRRNASNNLRVLVRAVGALELIGLAVRSRERRAALRSQLERFRETLEQLPGLAADCHIGIAACKRVQEALEQPSIAAGECRSEGGGNGRAV